MKKWIEILLLLMCLSLLIPKKTLAAFASSTEALEGIESAGKVEDHLSETKGWNNKAFLSLVSDPATDDSPEALWPLGEISTAMVKSWREAHPALYVNTSNKQLSNSTSKRLEIKDDCVTPQMFGAMGDGKTDDSEAFQLALDSGKSVYLPNGKYLVAGTVIIHKDTVIFGNDFSSKIIITGNITTDHEKHNISIHDLMISVSKKGGNALEIISENNALADHTLDIRDVCFEFDNTVTDSTAVMLYLYGVRESMISNCVFTGSDYRYPVESTAIKAEANSTHLTMNINISGCAFSYLGNAIWLNGTIENQRYLAGFRVCNNTIIGCNYGVRVVYFDTPAICNNMIDYCTHPVDLEGSTNITVSDNYIQTEKGTACILIKNGGQYSNDIINISSNVIHSGNGMINGSETTDGIVFVGFQSPEILRHIMVKDNFLFRIKNAVNLDYTQHTMISGNIVFYSGTFIDGNNTAEHTIVTDNYVQRDVSFVKNITPTTKIGRNEWGEKHTTGTINGEFTFSVDANSEQEYYIAFADSKCYFFDTPAVSLAFKDVGKNWRNMFFALTNVTPEGFTVKIVNSGDTPHSNVLRWSATLN